ncbi:hypothetical protein KJ708_13950 [bacterium]|nr:hypothetical protein [bacterium]
MAWQKLTALPKIVQLGLTLPGCHPYGRVTDALALKVASKPEVQVGAHTVSYYSGKKPGETLALWDGLVAGKASPFNSVHVRTGGLGKGFLTVHQSVSDLHPNGYKQSPVQIETGGDSELYITAPQGDFISGKRVTIAGPFDITKRPSVTMTDRSQIAGSEFEDTPLYSSGLLLAIADRNQTVKIYMGDTDVDAYEGGLFQLADDIAVLLDMVLDENDLGVCFNNLSLEAPEQNFCSAIRSFWERLEERQEIENTADGKALVMACFIHEFIDNATAVLQTLARYLTAEAFAGNISNDVYREAMALYAERGLSNQEIRVEVAARREFSDER